MAILEKIRKKSALLFIVIIGALLAFILGDFINNGRSFFGAGDTVAKANGAEVKYDEYQKALSQAQKDQQLQGMDEDLLASMVIDHLLTQALLDNEADEMGIEITDQQLADFMKNPNNIQAIGQYLVPDQDAQMLVMSAGIIDANSYLDAISNPKKYKLDEQQAQVLAANWAEAEKQIERQMRQMRYDFLLSGLFGTNDADALVAYNNANTLVDAQVVAVENAIVKDEEVKLTDADYQKYYDAHKGGFKIKDENRAVSYILAPIIPSQKDFDASAQTISQLMADLQAKPGIEGSEGYAGLQKSRGNLTVADIAQNTFLNPLLLGLDSIADGEVRLPYNMNGNYLVAKIMGDSTGIDKVTYTVLAAENINQLDSLGLTTANIDSIAAGFDPRNVNAQLSLIKQSEGLGETTRLMMATAPLDTMVIFTDTLQQQPMALALKVTSRSEPVKYWDIATFGYETAPSNATRQELTQKFHNYVANNSTAETFSKNATANDYTVLTDIVSATSYGLTNANRSRGLVKWAMDADKGQVSPVITMNAKNQNETDYLVAVAVDDIYDYDYLPVTDKSVRDMIRPVILNEKKSQILVDRYKGKAKDIEGYAAAMNATPITRAISYAAMDLAGDAQAQVATAKDGALVGPVAGLDKVYVIKVNKVTPADPANFKAEDYRDGLNRNALGRTIYEMNQYGQPQGYILDMLVGNNKKQVNILEFTESLTK